MNQFTPEQFESRIGCRLLFSTVADGKQVGPMREGRINYLSPNREWVLLSINPIYAIQSTDNGGIVGVLVVGYGDAGWFKISGLDVLDIWEPGS